MNLFGGFKENSDVHDINKNVESEICQEAQEKFETLMGDSELQDLSDMDFENQSENPSVSLTEKFERLFHSDYEPTEISENNADRIEAAESFDESKKGNSDVSEETAENYRIPRNGGEWSGEPGNSEWQPDSDMIPGDRNGTNPDDKTWKEIKDQYDFEGISFEDGRPDFSEVSKGDVQIEEFSDNRRRNFVQADEKLAEQKGCQPSEVRQWRTENKYTWHEEADCKSMRKVPSEVHGNIPHDGGISEMKSQRAEQE